MAQIVVRETVEATPPTPWTREVNMPPQEWFQGEWFMQRRVRELRAEEDARQAKRDKVKQIVAEVVLQIVGGIGFIGAICGYVALLWLMR